MIDGYFFNLLEALARSLKNNDKPFGGIQLIISGDFLQLPPVSKYGQAKKKFCFQVLQEQTNWIVLKNTIDSKKNSSQKLGKNA